jgi:hypothetical protein
MKKQNFFKTNLWLMMIALFAIPFITISCSDDDEPEPVTITIDDAAELVALSIANRTYGVVNDLNYVANNVLELVDCNESESTSRTANETSSDGEITVTYDISENYSKTCGTEEIVNYSFNADQLLTSNRLDLEHDLNGSWAVGGIESGSTELTYNGSYSRSGLWTYNLEDNHIDNVTFSSILSNLKADPSDGRITGGIATFMMNGTSAVYDSYSYEGNIEFQGSDISIITFQTGEQYELNLETGTVTRI